MPDTPNASRVEEARTIKEQVAGASLQFDPRYESAGYEATWDDVRVAMAAARIELADARNNDRELAVLVDLVIRTERAGTLAMLGHVVASSPHALAVAGPERTMEEMRAVKHLLDGVRATVQRETIQRVKAKVEAMLYPDENDAEVASANNAYRDVLSALADLAEGKP